VASSTTPNDDASTYTDNRNISRSAQQGAAVGKCFILFKLLVLFTVITTKIVGTDYHDDWCPRDALAGGGDDDKRQCGWQREWPFSFLVCHFCFSDFTIDSEGE
jgi:hypothetical protein